MMGTTNAELRLTAVTDNFKSEMKAAGKSVKDFGQAVGTVGNSVGSVANLSRAFSDTASAISSGNVTSSLTGMVSSLSGLATVTPAVSAGLKGFSMLLPALGPLGIGIGAVALAATAVGGAFLSAKSQADALNKQRLETITDAVKTLAEGAARAADKLASMLGFDVEGRALQKTYDKAREALEAYANDHKEVMDQLRDKTVKDLDEMLLSGEASFGSRLWKAGPFAGMFASEGDIEELITAKKGIEDAKKALDSYRATQDEIAKRDTWKKQETGAQDYNKELQKTRDILKQIKTQGNAKAEARTQRDEFIGSIGRKAAEAFDAQLQKVNQYYEKAGRDIDASAEGAFGDVADSFKRVADRAAADAQFLDSTAGQFYQLGSIVSEKVGRAAAQYGEQVAGAMGEAGGVVSSAMQGFAQGGIWGAIIAVVLQLAQKMAAFKDIMSMLSQMFQWTGDLFNPFLQAIKPLVKSLISLTQVMTALGNSVAMAGPVTEVLGKVADAFARAIGWLVKALGGVVNWFVELAADVADWWGGGDEVRKAKINTNLLGKTQEEAAPGTAAANGFYGMGVGAASGGASASAPYDALADSAASAASALGDVASKSQAVSESLTNVPTGYKVALARFNATSPIGPPSPGGPGGPGGTSIQVGTMIVQAPDADVAKAIKRDLERSNLVRTGSPLFSASPYIANRALVR